MTPLEALQKAVDTAAGGSPSAFAALLGGGVYRQNVEYWLRVGRVPAEHCPSIERVTRVTAAEKDDASLIVTCEALRPDVGWDVLRDQAAA